MSNPLHPMVRRSERGPRADTAGGKDPSSGSDGQPYEMESNLTSSETTTESQSTDSADELTEPVAAEMASSVNGSPGVEMGMSGDAIPVPEVEPEDPAATEVNTYHYDEWRFRSVLYCIASYIRPIRKMQIMIPGISH